MLLVLFVNLFFFSMFLCGPPLVASHTHKTGLRGPVSLPLCPDSAPSQACLCVGHRQVRGDVSFQWDPSHRWRAVLWWVLDWQLTLCSCIRDSITIPLHFYLNYSLIILKLYCLRMFVNWKTSPVIPPAPPPRSNLLERTYTLKRNVVSCHGLLTAEAEPSENWEVKQIAYSTYSPLPHLLPPASPALGLCWQGDLPSVYVLRKMWPQLHLSPFSLFLSKCRSLCCNKTAAMKTDIIKCLFSQKVE